VEISGTCGLGTSGEQRAKKAVFKPFFDKYFDFD
jgi:hypothetical protein